jgi:hypothetical protein
MKYIAMGKKIISIGIKDHGVSEWLMKRGG